MENEILRKIKPCRNDKYIFVSYSSKDKEVVYRDVYELQRRGWNVWLDEKNLDKTKSSWRNDALVAIEQVACRLGLFYVGENSLRSENCYKEIEHMSSMEVKETHLGKSVGFIAVEVNDIQDIKNLGETIIDELPSSEIPMDMQTKHSKIVHNFIYGPFKGNNDRIRIKPLSFYPDSEDYYKQFEEQFEKAGIKKTDGNHYGRVKIFRDAKDSIYRAKTETEYIKAEEPFAEFIATFANDALDENAEEEIDLDDELQEAERLKEQCQEKATDARKASTNAEEIGGMEENTLQNEFIEVSYSSPSEANDSPTTKEVLKSVPSKRLESIIEIFISISGKKLKKSHAFTVRVQKPTTVILTLIVICGMLLALAVNSRKLSYPFLWESSTKNDYFNKKRTASITTRPPSNGSGRGFILDFDLPYYIEGLYYGNEFSIYDSIRREKISSITFLDSNSIESNELKNEGVRLVGNNTFIWYKKAENDLYDLFVASDAPFVMPEDCSYYFAGYANMRSLKGTVNTSHVTNMGSMFYGCEKLEELDLEGFITSSVTDMSFMFYGCAGLAEMNIHNFDTTNVTNMRAMFYGCEDISKMNFNSFNTSNVTDMSFMFYGCTGLSDLNLDSFNTTNVNDMSCMFCGCTGLSSLELDALETSNVTEMSGMFYKCTSLTKLDLSGFNTLNATNIEGMFGGCMELSDLVLGRFDTSSVTTMSALFLDCVGLTEIEAVILNTSKVTDMSRMFSGCSHLQSLDVNGFNTSNVSDMSYMFSGCKELEKIDVTDFNTDNVTSMEGMFYDCQMIETVDASAFETENVINMSHMFENCEKMKNAYVGKFDTRHVTDMSYMFNGCKNLEFFNITLPSKTKFQNDGQYSLNLENAGYYWDTQNVEDFSSMFKDCESLNILAVSFNTTSTKNMSGMFQGCKSLESLDVSSFDTSNVTDMAAMFEGCDSLKELDISNFDTSNVKYFNNFMPNELNPNWRNRFGQK